MTVNHPAPHTFFFGPFRLLSELDIPPLHKLTGSGRLPVSIRLADVPPHLPGAKVFDEFCQVAPHSYLLDMPGVARFLVRNGNEVQVQLAPNAPLANVCSFLLGSVFGALCHQNGLLPLHAGAVERNGEVTAFLGDSGAGKSTLVACLQARGHRIVADDICLLEDTPEGMTVIPVAGWLKLWRQSLDHLGQQPDERNRVFVANDKYRLYLDPVTAGPTRLKNIVLLSRAHASAEDPAAAPRLEPLAPVEALAAMMEKTYLAYVVELNGTQSALFQTCARVLSQAQAYRLTAPWGLDHLDAVLNLLEAHLFSFD